MEHQQQVKQQKQQEVSRHKSEGYHFSVKLAHPFSGAQKELFKNEDLMVISPAKALGGYIARKNNSKNKFTINVPLMELTIEFSSNEDANIIGEKIRCFNLCCSLQGCIFALSEYTAQDGTNYLDVDIMFIDDGAGKHGQFLAQSFPEFKVY